MNKAETFFKQFFNMSALDVANIYDYSYDNKKLLSLTTEEELAEYYPELYMSDFNHLKDNRTQLDFVKQIICNWLMEDYIKQLISSPNIEVINNGSDSERTFTTHPNNRSDYIINYMHHLYNVELQISYTYYWKNNKRVFLRDNKYNNMKKNNDFLLLVDVSGYDISFSLIDVARDSTAKFTESNPNCGGKPGYDIDLTYYPFYILTSENFECMLYNLILNREGY